MTSTTTKAENTHPASHPAAAGPSKTLSASSTEKIADGLEKLRARIEHTLDADALAMLSAAITELRAL